MVNPGRKRARRHAVGALRRRPLEGDVVVLRPRAHRLRRRPGRRGRAGRGPAVGIWGFGPGVGAGVAGAGRAVTTGAGRAPIAGLMIPPAGIGRGCPPTARHRPDGRSGRGDGGRARLRRRGLPLLAGAVLDLRLVGSDARAAKLASPRAGADAGRGADAGDAAGGASRSGAACSGRAPPPAPPRRARGPSRPA